MHWQDESEQVPESGKIRLVQLTDCHLGPELGYKLAGVRTHHSLTEVLANLKREQPPEYVIVTGDIAAQGSPEAYARFLALMDHWEGRYGWLPGNHDDVELMIRIGGNLYLPMRPLGNWRLISLNTAVPDQVGGHLSGEALCQLEKDLCNAGENPVAIFMHHPPVPVGCQWLDRQQVSNSKALENILRHFNNVRAIFTGHVHQEAALSFTGIPLYTTPSTCFQFAAHQEEFRLATLPPAYRWIEFDDKGSLQTGVIYLSDSEEKVDTGVQGY